jgi:hypothetical protein
MKNWIAGRLLSPIIMRLILLQSKCVQSQTMLTSSKDYDPHPWPVTELESKLKALEGSKVTSIAAWDDSGNGESHVMISTDAGSVGFLAKQLGICLQTNGNTEQGIGAGFASPSGDPA